jgi:hypothetical protein
MIFATHQQDQPLNRSASLLLQREELIEARADLLVEALSAWKAALLRSARCAF